MSLNPVTRWDISQPEYILEPRPGLLPGSGSFKPIGLVRFLSFQPGLGAVFHTRIGDRIQYAARDSPRTPGIFVSFQPSTSALDFLKLLFNDPNLPNQTFSFHDTVVVGSVTKHRIALGCKPSIASISSQNILPAVPSVLASTQISPARILDYSTAPAPLPVAATQPGASTIIDKTDSTGLTLGGTSINFASLMLATEYDLRQIYSIGDSEAAFSRSNRKRIFGNVRMIWDGTTFNRNYYDRIKADLVWNITPTVKTTITGAILTSTDDIQVNLDNSVVYEGYNFVGSDVKIV